MYCLIAAKGNCPPPVVGGGAETGSVALENMHKTRATQSTVVLQRGARAFHLALARLAAQLLGQFSDLGQSGGAPGDGPWPVGRPRG